MSHVDAAQCRATDQGDKPRMRGVYVEVFVPAGIAAQAVTEYRTREGLSSRLLAEMARILAEPLAAAMDVAEKAGKLPLREGR